MEAASPAMSDDGVSFEDAADGSSPLPSPLPETESGGKQDRSGEDGIDPAVPTEEKAPATPPPPSVLAAEQEHGSGSSAGKGGKAKGAGVTALLARFQNSTEAVPSGLASASSSRNVSPSTVNRLARPKSSKKKSMDQQADPVEESKGAHDDAGDKTITDGSSTGLEGALEQAHLINDKREIAPSKGALSLLDPSETIKNPFEGGGATPVLESSPSNDMTEEDIPPTTTTLAERSDPKRYSALSSPQDAESVPATPTASQANRFSTVSLSTTAPIESKRDTIYAQRLAAPPTPVSDPNSSSYTQAEFLARQTARLSRADGDHRASMEGAERIKEKLNELRYGHSRDNSEHSTAIGENGVGGGDLDEGMGRESRSSLSASEHGLSDPPLGPGKERIDWDFWGDVMSNYQEIARTQPRELSRAIQAGIPGALRGMMWQLMSSSKDEEMEIIYAYYLKQSSPHEKMIRKDLARTFPAEEYFKDGQGGGQEDLFNVVKAYSLYDEECGYCQGMQFVVGPLLLNMPVEEAFSTLVRLMKSYDLRGHFVPNMPALQLRLFQFDRLLEETLPLLHRHLVRSGVKSSMYASGWFMTLFSYRSPLNICFRILDSVFAEGIEALFRFALALMKKNEEDLLQMSFEEAVPLLAAKVFDVYKSEKGETGGDVGELEEVEGSGGADVGRGYRVNEFVRDAFEFKVTPFMLDSYASDFAEQVRIATAHRREVDGLKIANKHLQAKVKNLEDQLGAVQQEHVDLVKNVVMAKLAKEEMEEELVRYKLMYAEATLLADQSGVNRPDHSNLTPSTTSSSFLHQQSS